MIRFDHVALASRHAWPMVTRYGHQLGGRWLGGPDRTAEEDFYFCQLEFEGGTKLELLEPVPGPGSDFLRRFLDRNGPGPHHFTFKVSDFDAAVESAVAAGYDVIGIDRSEPDWHEGFLHPKQSHGIVIQLAYQGPEGEEWQADGAFPPALRPQPARLAEVEHVVAELDPATKLFAGPLGMEEVERGSDHDGEFVVLTSGPWRLRLVCPENPSWQHWLGTRPGRMLRITMVTPEPGTIPDAVAVGDGTYDVAPEANLGTRLRLLAPDPS